MRVNKYVMDATYEASADLSAYQWRFVKPTTGVATGPMARLAACTSGIGFILQNKPAALGRGGVIRIYGFSELVVDGTSGGGIVPGNHIKPAAAGVGVVCTAGDTYSAIAFEASIASGDRIEVLCERGVLHS